MRSKLTAIFQQFRKCRFLKVHPPLKVEHCNNRFVQVLVSGLTPGNNLIETSLVGVGQNMQKHRKAVITETIRLYSFFTQNDQSFASKVLKGTVTIYLNESPEPVVRDCVEDFRRKLGKILDDTKFSDFMFLVKGKEFKVHRAILAEASPVFTKLFTVDMEEAKNNECIVEDIEPDVFEHLLQFIYKREMPENIPEIAMKLFEAAHYYEIDELKAICEKELLKSLKISNAVKIFNWAWMYGCEELKDKAWIVIKSDILKLSKPLKIEPPIPDVLKKMIEQKIQNDSFWAEVIKEN